MAKFRPLLGELSGKLDAEVYSHNRGGPYVKAWVLPADPATGPQLLMRAYLQTLAIQWRTVLTATQRDAWDTYAHNVTVPTRLHPQDRITGRAHYMRSNLARNRSAFPTVHDAPTTYNLGEANWPAITIYYRSPISIWISFDPTDAWANEAEAGLLQQQSRPAPGLHVLERPLPAGAASRATPPPHQPHPRTVPFNSPTQPETAASAASASAGPTVDFPPRTTSPGSMLLTPNTHRTA
jgi:hypothetical protein